MKKIQIALSAAVLLLASCDPSMDNINGGFDENVTAESVQATVTPVQVNGKSTNLLVVENHSPITSQWTVGQLIESDLHSSKNYDTIYVTKLGTNTVSMQCRNLKNDFTKQFSVNTEEIYYLTDALTKRLCVSGTPGNYRSTDKDVLGNMEVKFGTTFDPAKVKVVQEKDNNGVGGNVFNVYNGNGVLTNWKLISLADNSEAGTSDTNVGKMLTLSFGKYKIVLDYQKADGTTGTYDAGTFDVQTMTYKTELIQYLSGGADGDGTTTWEWDLDADGVWGNGPYGSGNAPQWWIVKIGDIDGQAGGHALSLEGHGQGAWFTLDLNNWKIVNSDGTETAFKINVLDHKKEGWDQGALEVVSLDKPAIPMGIDVNHGNAVFAKYYILTAKDGKLAITAGEMPENGCAWFYMFRLKK